MGHGMPLPPVQQPSELRRDPFRGEWVIVAPGRAMRPQPRHSPALLDATAPGPFVAGHESMTPPEVYAAREEGTAPNAPGWRVRVVPNLYPALRVEHAPEASGEGPSDRYGGTGAHEVIIEDPERTADLTDMTEEHVTEVLRAWRARVQDLKRDVRLACAVIFRHRGAEAGATVAHPHSQLMAMPFVPPRVASENRACGLYHQAHGRCALCDVLVHERRVGVRMLVEEDGAVAFCPYASRLPYEVLVAPTSHQSALEDAPDATLSAVARTLKSALQKLDARLSRPPMQLWLRSAPWRADPTDRGALHWHLCLMPLTHRLGGLEAGFGVHINTVLPEEAARTLRG